MRSSFVDGLAVAAGTDASGSDSRTESDSRSESGEPASDRSVVDRGVDTAPSAASEDRALEGRPWGVEDDAEDDADDESGPSVSAAAIPGLMAMAAPIPKAPIPKVTANPPTRPMKTADDADGRR